MYHRRTAQFVFIFCVIFFTTQAHTMDLFNGLVATAHTYLCPRCLFFPEINEQRMKCAIDNDSPEDIAWLCNRRGVSPHMILDDEAPIIRAARQGNYRAVEQLLELGAHPDSQFKGQTLRSYPSALIAACISDKNNPENVAKTVRILLQHKADPQLTHTGLSASEEKEMLKAVYDEEIKQRECSWKFNTPAKSPRTFFTARTAHQFAVLNKYTQAAELLAENK